MRVECKGVGKGKYRPRSINQNELGEGLSTINRLYQVVTKFSLYWPVYRE
jgi:hypothetical protein